MLGMGGLSGGGGGGGDPRPLSGGGAKSHATKSAGANTGGASNKGGGPNPLVKTSSSSNISKGGAHTRKGDTHASSAFGPSPRPSDAPPSVSSSGKDKSQAVLVVTGMFGVRGNPKELHNNAIKGGSKYPTGPAGGGKQVMPSVAGNMVVDVTGE